MVIRSCNFEDHYRIVSPFIIRHGYIAFLIPEDYHLNKPEIESWPYQNSFHMDVMMMVFL